MWMLAHNHPENRWYDKSHQLIISGNGKAGLNRDHTAVDGNPTARYISEVCQRAQQILERFQTIPLENPNLALEEGTPKSLGAKAQKSLQAPSQEKSQVPPPSKTSVEIELVTSGFTPKGARGKRFRMPGT